MIFFNKKRSNK